MVVVRNAAIEDAERILEIYQKRSITDGKTK